MSGCAPPLPYSLPPLFFHPPGQTRLGSPGMIVSSDADHTRQRYVLCITYQTSGSSEFAALTLETEVEFSPVSDTRLLMSFDEQQPLMAFHMVAGSCYLAEDRGGLQEMRSIPEPLPASPDDGSLAV